MPSLLEAIEGKYGLGGSCDPQEVSVSVMCFVVWFGVFLCISIGLFQIIFISFFFFFRFFFFFWNYGCGYRFLCQNCHHVCCKYHKWSTFLVFLEFFSFLRILLLLKNLLILMDFSASSQKAFLNSWTTFFCREFFLFLKNVLLLKTCSAFGNSAFENMSRLA